MPDTEKSCMQQLLIASVLSGCLSERETLIERVCPGGLVKLFILLQVARNTNQEKWNVLCEKHVYTRKSQQLIIDFQKHLESDFLSATLGRSISKKLLLTV